MSNNSAKDILNKRKQRQQNNDGGGGRGQNDQDSSGRSGGRGGGRGGNNRGGGGRGGNNRGDNNRGGGGRGGNNRGGGGRGGNNRGGGQGGAQPQPGGAQSGSIFSGVRNLDNRTQRRNSERIRPGDYVLQLLRTDGGPSEKEPGVNYFATEWRVLWAQSVDPDDPANRLGEHVAKAMMLKSQPAFREVVNVVCATLDIDPEGLSDAELETICDDFIIDEGDYVIEDEGRDVVFCEGRRNDRGYTDLYFLPIEDAPVDWGEWLPEYDGPNTWS